MSQEEEGPTSVNRASYAYRAEYAPSGRAKCKKCEQPIEKSSLKVSYLVPSRFHQGQDARAHHLKCFFAIRRPKSIAEFDNFNRLKFEDQQLLEKAIETQGASVLGLEAKTDDGTDKKNGKKSKKRAPDAPDDTTNYEDFHVEYAKSSRATCIICQEKIPKNEVRICTYDYDETMINNLDIGPVPRWHHVDCFASTAEHIDFNGSIKKIPGFNDLEKDDKKMLISKFKYLPKVTPAKKAKQEPKNEVKNEEDAEETKLLKKQSQRFHVIRESLEKMKRSELEEILRANYQKVHRNPSALRDHVADILLYGALKPCEECGGPLILSASAYICLGSDGIACTAEYIDPVREEPIIPDEIVDKYEFFQSEYKFRGGKRIFPTKLVKAVEKKEQQMIDPVNRDGVLYGLKIGVTQWKNMKPGKDIIEKKMHDLGVEPQLSFNSKLFVMVASKEEFVSDPDQEPKPLSPKLEAAIEAGIPVVTPGFLFRLKKIEQLPILLKECLISDWDGDFAERYANFTVKKEK